MKPNLIAYCGLNCEECEAYKATINNDDELRGKVAKEWSNLNNVKITKEMINWKGAVLTKNPVLRYLKIINLKDFL